MSNHDQRKWGGGEGNTSGGRLIKGIGQSNLEKSTKIRKKAGVGHLAGEEKREILHRHNYFLGMSHLEKKGRDSIYRIIQHLKGRLFR